MSQVNPSPDLWEALQARRARRRWVLGILAVALLGVLGFKAVPFARAIKGWQARRLAREALVLMEQERWREAFSKTQDAYQLRPTEPETWRAAARLLTRTGQGPAALEWWAQLAAAGRLTPEDRRGYANAALAAGDLTTAATEVGALLAQPGGPTPADTLLSAQLAARRGLEALAVSEAERTQADARASPTQRLTAATLIVSILSTETAAYTRAWGVLAELARDPGNPASLDALDQLVRRPAPTSSPLLADALFPAAAPATSIMPPEEIAAALDAHPRARPFHHLLALELRARGDLAHADVYIAQAVTRFGGSDDQETLAALGTWLQARGRFETVLQVLPLERALQRRDLFLVHLDALASLGRWREVKDLLFADRFPLEPVVRFMYLATARGKLGEMAASAGEWRRALAAADTPEKLLAVGNQARRFGAPDVAETAVDRALALAPKLPAARAARRQLDESRAAAAEFRVPSPPPGPAPSPSEETPGGTR